MMIFFLALQGSLALAVLCARWRRPGAARRALAARAITLIPALTLAAAAALLLADKLLVWRERAMILALAALTGFLWLFGFVRTGSARESDRLYRSPAPVGDWWIMLCLLLQGAFLLTSTWIATQNFIARASFMAAVWRGLWLTLMAGPLSGGMLLAGLLAAILAGRRAAWGWPLVGLLLARGAALAASLGLWFYACPFSPSFFASRLLNNGLSLLLFRVLMGLVLPLLFVLLAMQAGKDETGPNSPVQHLLPALIVVLIGEMLGSALAAGLAGVAL